MSEQNAADRWAVQDVLSNYTMAVDERDMVQYRNCFADDVVVVGFGENVYNGGDEWTAYVIEALKAYGPTQHMLGPMFAKIDGDDAKTRTDVQAHHYLIDAPDTTLTLWATYVTDMKRINGEWKIVRHELVSRGTRIEKDQEL
jgi:ketosteroid isomerase-like protein